MVSGEALYRFLLSQSDIPPRMTMHVEGTHTEVNYVERVKRQPNGEMRVTREPLTDTIKDFSFSIDLTPLLVGPPEEFTVPDDEPAFRGHMFRQTAKGGVIGPREMYTSAAWRAERERRGQAPWTWMGQERGRSEGKTVREWADDFCASRKLLKEFDYRKVVYGWDLKAIEASKYKSPLYRLRAERSFSFSHPAANTTDAVLRRRRRDLALSRYTYLHPTYIPAVQAPHDQLVRLHLLPSL